MVNFLTMTTNVPRTWLLGGTLSSCAICLAELNYYQIHTHFPHFTQSGSVMFYCTSRHGKMINSASNTI